MRLGLGCFNIHRIGTKLEVYASYRIKLLRSNHMSLIVIYIEGKYKF